MENDPLRDVVVVTFPEDVQVVRVDVDPGDTVVLPFDGDAPLQAREGSGNLGIRDDRDRDRTVILQGFAEAVNDAQHPIVIESRDGTVIDVALVLAMTDPNLDVQICGTGASDGGMPVSTGGIYQPFEGGVALRHLTAIGRQDDSTGLLATTDPGQQEL